MPSSYPPPFSTKNANWVKNLAQINRHDLAIAGGKGANLGELIRINMPVPAGFVVTTAAYDAFIAHNALTELIAREVAQTDFTDSAAVAQAAQTIQQAIEAAPIPAPIAQTVRQALHELGKAHGDAPVAVRSSATAEDLPDAAFAGQQETFLNVIGEASILDAIRGCWASLWGERALVYRHRQQIKHLDTKLAVVVQQMVAAQVAGVMFTANPLNHERGEMVIDASEGLGEAVVSGLVTPDHYVIDQVDKRPMRIKTRQIGRREVQIRSKAGGGTETIQQNTPTQQAALNDAQINTLAALGKRIEQHYGAAQDIEWAWATDPHGVSRLYILQSRPITTLKPPLKLGRVQRMLAQTLGEVIPMRPYPFDMSSSATMVLGGMINIMQGLFGLNMPPLASVLVEKEGVMTEIMPQPITLSKHTPLAILRALRQARRVTVADWQSDPTFAALLARAQMLESQNWANLSWAELIGVLQQAGEIGDAVLTLRKRYFPAMMLGRARMEMLLRLAGQSQHSEALTQGILTQTEQTNRALQALADDIRADAALQALFANHTPTALLQQLPLAAPAFFAKFNQFLLRYGYRETSVALASQPTWKDQPEAPLGLLKVIAAAPASPPAHADWQAVRDAILAKSWLGKPIARNLFKRTLDTGRVFILFREDTHFYVVLAYPALRRGALALGQRLAAAGAVNEAEDVFHLRLDELAALDEHQLSDPVITQAIKAKVQTRKAKRAALANTPLIDPRAFAHTDTNEKAADTTGAILRGTAGSAGITEGPVCIINGPAEFGKLKPGDVLVAPNTNPAWTPLFLNAAAVVVNAGSAMSHAAIVAREYGLPAVMGAYNATQILRDGQRVRVDGGRGLVFDLDAN